MVLFSAHQPSPPPYSVITLVSVCAQPTILQESASLQTLPSHRSHLHLALPSLSSSRILPQSNMLPELLCPSFQLLLTSISSLQIPAVSSGQTDIGCSPFNPLPSPPASYSLYCVLASSQFSINSHRIPAAGLPLCPCLSAYLALRSTDRTPYFHDLSGKASWTATSRTTGPTRPPSYLSPCSHTNLTNVQLPFGPL